MSARARLWRFGLAMLGAQLVAMALYVYAERQRERGAALAQLSPRRLDVALPPLTWRALKDNQSQHIQRVERTTLVHIWASWCPPCREELPALMAFGQREDVPIVALALDKERELIWTYAPGFEAQQGYALRGHEALPGAAVALPLTFVVEPPNRIVAAFHGAKAWDALRRSDVVGAP